MKCKAYWHLMRFHKPQGILLLWAPTAWALWLANDNFPALSLVLLFLLGTVVMRAAGCIVNDLADRHFDKHVARTVQRPITSGEVGLMEAFILLVLLLLSAFYIITELPRICFYYALLALVITGVYPFSKRFFHAPQLILGLAFSMGIPIAFAASGIYNSVCLLVLFLLNFAWIVAYDTMYAMADKEDDLRIRIKSTAILFAKQDRLVILLLQIFYHALWLLLASLLSVSISFYGFWALGFVIIVYQQYLIAAREPKACLLAFSINSWYGLLMWLALVVQQVDNFIQ